MKNEQRLQLRLVHPEVEISSFLRDATVVVPGHGWLLAYEFGCTIAVHPTGKSFRMNASIQARAITPSLLAWRINNDAPWTCISIHGGPASMHFWSDINFHPDIGVVSFLSERHTLLTDRTGLPLVWPGSYELILLYEPDLFLGFVNGAWGAFRFDGSIIVEPLWTSLDYCVPHGFYIAEGDEGTGILGPAGDIVLQPTREEIKHLGGAWFAVCENGRFAIYDALEGLFTSHFKFDQVMDFGSGTVYPPKFIASIDDHHVITEPSGVPSFAFRGGKLQPLSHGYLKRTLPDGRTVLIDPEFAPILTCDDINEWFWSRKDILFSIREGSNWTLIDSCLRKLLPPAPYDIFSESGNVVIGYIEGAAVLVHKKRGSIIRTSECRELADGLVAYKQHRGSWTIWNTFEDISIEGLSSIGDVMEDLIAVTRMGEYHILNPLLKTIHRAHAGKIVYAGDGILYALTK